MQKKKEKQEKAKQPKYELDWGNLPDIKESKGTKTVDVDSVIIKDNIREDIAIDEELVNSIIIHGVHTPIKLTLGNELVFGSRRVAHTLVAIEKCKKNEREDRANLIRQIPYTVFEGNDEAIFFLQRDENRRRKDLNPIEDANSYKRFMDKTKHSVEYVAKMDGVTTDYVERRLALLKATKKVKQALIDKKIELGHAVILSRLDNKQQEEELKSISEYNFSVKEFAEGMDFDTCDLSSALFDKKDCKNCASNGGSQMMLTDLNESAADMISDECFNKACYKKKASEWVVQQKKDLKQQGINVMTEEEVKKLPYSKKISDWEEEHKKASKIFSAKDKKTDTYAVVFDTDSMPPTREIYRIKSPDQVRKEANKEGKSESNELEVQSKAKSEKALKEKMTAFKRDFLLDVARKKMKPGLELDRLCLWFLMDHFNCNSYKDAAGKKTGIESDHDIVDDVFKLPKDKIQQAKAELGKAMICEIDNNDELQHVAEAFGMKLEKDFKWTEEFLNLFTKSQLDVLAAEIFISDKVSGVQKKPDKIREILACKIIGVVPKVFKENKD